MNEIEKINDKMFKKTFGKPENVTTFLNIALPDSLKKRIDLKNLSIDPNEYVSNNYKNSHSDLVVKTHLISKQNKKQRLDIYFILEHKTSAESKKKTFIQILKYLYSEWQEDVDQKRSLRIIIPLIFYHGKKKWNVPQSFVDMFDVEDEVKEFLLDFRYVFFDTGDWDFMAGGNEELKQNVFLMTAMVLMKCAFYNDMETVKQILRFWKVKGFTNEKEQAIFFLQYITETHDMKLEELQEILEEIDLEGGDIMPTLAQRLRDEGRAEGITKGRAEGITKGRAEGENNAKIKIARELLKKGIDKQIIISTTGINKKKLEELAAKDH